MKNLLLFSLGVAMVSVFGCETPGTHSSVSTTEKVSMPDLNTNTVTPGQIATTNLNTTTTSDIQSPK